MVCGRWEGGGEAASLNKTGSSEPPICQEFHYEIGQGQLSHPNSNLSPITFSLMFQPMQLDLPGLDQVRASVDCMCT